jgi:hypothetical protein
VGRLDVPSTAVALWGHWAFVAAGPARLLVVDLRDWTHPEIKGEVALPAAAAGLHTSGGLLFVTTGESVLAFDAADPPSLRLVGERVLPGAGLVTSEAPRVYVVADGGLFVLTFDGALPARAPEIFMPAAFARGR